MPMPRKAAVKSLPIEPEMEVLTPEKVQKTFKNSDYMNLINKFELAQYKDRGQNYSLWLRDNCGNLQLLTADKSSKQCTFFGNIEGTKFNINLTRDFFNSVVNLFVRTDYKTWH